MALIIFSHYRWEEIVARKLPCLLWTVIGVAVGTAYVILGQPLQYFANGRFVAALDVLLFGYILIHTFISAVIDKKRPQIDKKLMSLWTVMMLLMIFSRSDYIWPLCYLVMFWMLLPDRFYKRRAGRSVSGRIKWHHPVIVCLSGILLYLQTV